MKPHSNKTSHVPSKGALHTSQPVQWPLLLRAVGMGLGIVVCVTVLLGASDQTEDDEATNRKKIEAMSPAQREQLKRNYEKYQKLSVADKEKYRKIHIATRGPSKLNRLMHSYNDWVKTLSPWQQEDLRNAKTTAQRIELIRKFRSAQERSKRSGNYRDDVFELLIANSKDLKKKPEFMRGLMRWIPIPPADLFQETIKIIEKNLPSVVKYRKPEDPLSEYERSLAILQSLTGLQEHKGPPSRSVNMSREVIDQITELMNQKNYQSRSISRTINGKKAPREIQNRRNVMQLLSGGLKGQLITSAKQQLDQIQPQPSEEELQNYFETSLNTREQDNLMNHPPDVMQEKLRYHYLSKHLPPEVRESLQNQFQQYIQLWDQFINRGMKERGVRRFGGDRPPNDRNRERKRSGGPGGKGLKPRFQRESSPDA